MKRPQATLILAIGMLAAPVAAFCDARIYDIAPPERVTRSVPDATVQGRIDALRRTLGDGALVTVHWDAVANQLRSIAFSPPLPQPENADIVARARAFLDANPALFALSSESLAAMTPKIERRDGQSQSVVFVQRFGGIPFFGQQGFLRVVLTSVGVAAVSGHCAATPPDQTVPKLGVPDAYAKMRQQLPNLWKTADGRPSPHDGAAGAPTFEPDARIETEEPLPERQRTLIKHVGMDFTGELTARLTYFLDGTQARLAWEFSTQGTMDRFDEPGTNGAVIGALEVVIDAQDGRVLLAHVDGGNAVVGIARSRSSQLR